VTYVRGNGKHLPFQGKAFDIVYSNAVVEHVGASEEQRQFISECLRVSRSLFIATPNRWFPLEPHTRIPFLGWLPYALFKKVVGRVLGRGYPLLPLSERDLLTLFPRGVHVKVIRQRSFLWLPHVLIAIASDEGDAPRAFEG
jgi:SAM-dependent methyltransferase